MENSESFKIKIKGEEGIVETPEIELYYNVNERRYLDFSVLLKNPKERKWYFLEDEKLVAKVVQLSEKFRETANSSAHLCFQWLRSMTLMIIKFRI